MAAVHRIMGNHRNDLLAATITSTGVKSSTDIRLVATTQTGNATVGLTGPYTGAANAVVDVEILDTLTDTIPRVSAPSFAGAGNGVLTTGAITSGSLAQTLTIKLTDTGVLTVNAALNFDEVVLQAKAIGAVGNGVQIRIDRTALAFTESAFSLLRDIEAGKEALEGPEFEWSTVAARSDGTIPDTAKRLTFGDDSTIYRQWKSYSEGGWQYHIHPALERAIPKGTRIVFVTGSRTVTISQGATSEVYPGIVTPYDLLSALQESSNLIEVVGVVTPDKQPGGMAMREVRARTDAHALPTTGDGSKYAKGFTAITIGATAATELVQATCWAISSKEATSAAIGKEIWKLKGSVSGMLNADFITGSQFTSASLQFTIPQKFPEGYNPIAVSPRGRFNLKQLTYASRDAGEPDPPICLKSMMLGIAAVDKTLTCIYTKRPVNDCGCETTRPEGRLNPECLGLDFIDGVTDMATDAGYITRLQVLAMWHSAFTRSNTQITAAGELRSADYDLQLADIARDELLSALEDVYDGAVTAQALWEASWDSAMGTVDSDLTVLEGVGAVVVPPVVVPVSTDRSSYLVVAPWNGSLGPEYGKETIMEPTDPNGYIYYFKSGVVNSTNAGAEPVWPTGVGASINVQHYQKLVTWECLAAVASTARVRFLNAYGTYYIDDLVTVTGSDFYRVIDPTTYGIPSPCVLGPFDASPPQWADGVITTFTGTTGVVQAVGITENEMLTLLTPSSVTNVTTYATRIPEPVTEPVLGSNLDINYTAEILTDPGFKYDVETWAKRVKSACNVVRAVAGLPPKKGKTSMKGNLCWSDEGSDYYWEINGTEYNPAFTNKIYHSCTTSCDGQVFSTHEFAFAIVVACPEKLLEGDTVVLEIGDSGYSGPAAYQVGDVLTLPVIAAAPLELAGGITGNDTLSWAVNSSLLGALPAYPVPLAAPMPYLSAAVQFTITPGAIAFAAGDTFTVAVEGGHFRWRRDSGSWSSTAAVAETHNLGDGLTLGFAAGPPPSLVTGDSWQWHVTQPFSPGSIVSPVINEGFEWPGSSVTIRADLGAVQPIPAVLLALHTLPLTAGLVLAGSDDGVTWWTQTITVQAGPLATFLTGKTARYLEMRITAATGARIGWWWAGTPFQPSGCATTIALSRVYGMARGSGLNPAALYRGQGQGGELAWDAKSGGWLEQSDMTELLALINRCKTTGDEPFALTPNVAIPAETALVVANADEVKFEDYLRFQDSQSTRYLSASIPLRAVLE